MADLIKKTPGARAVNSFPAIAFLITLGLAVIVYLGVF
jgi:hypothetical protein